MSFQYFTGGRKNSAAAAVGNILQLYLQKIKCCLNLSKVFLGVSCTQSQNLSRIFLGILHLDMVFQDNEYLLDRLNKHFYVFISTFKSMHTSSN